MSVAAVMMVRDEGDIIARTLRHLAREVDHIYVNENLSRDGTPNVLAELVREGLPLTVLVDQKLGYFQSRKTTRLARRAWKAGHRWVVPCDADELWFAPAGHTISTFLGSQAPDVQIVEAQLFNHIPTTADEQDGHPFDTIRWRLAEPGALPKVAARTSDDLVIENGNHGAYYGDGVGPVLRVPGLTIRHFTWRSPEQFLRKIRNGIEAYKATDLPPEVGTHWRMFDGHTDETILAHYDRWFLRRSPESDAELIYDPVTA